MHGWAAKSPPYDRAQPGSRALASVVVCTSLLSLTGPDAVGLPAVSIVAEQEGHSTAKTPGWQTRAGLSQGCFRMVPGLSCSPAVALSQNDRTEALRDALAGAALTSRRASPVQLLLNSMAPTGRYC
jgi:hypothetical protein